MERQNRYPGKCRPGSQRSSRRRARGPRPLEVETTQMPSDVDHFSDKKQTGNFLALHGFGGKLSGVDTPRCHFGLFVTLRSRREDCPGMRLLLEISESAIRP